MKPNRLLFSATFALAIALCCIDAQAKVVRIEVTTRTDVLNGKEFGPAGAYEQIAGKVYFTVDPNDPHNKT